jgi:hypothetical protein
MTRQPGLISMMIEETLVRTSWRDDHVAERRASA